MKKLVLALLCLAAANATTFAAAPTGLTTEYRVNPDGLDAPALRLSWRLPGRAPQRVGAGTWRFKV